MKRFAVLLLVLVVGVLIGRFSGVIAGTAEAGAAEGGGAAVVGNGDVNGDGTINISDATALLNWLFLGGASPQRCPSGNGGPSSFPATGQAGCYDEDGNSVDCEGDTCAGQDGFYRTGCPNEGRFVDNGDGTVTDNCTGLMWQMDTGNDGVALARCDALAYCESLELAGHGDWRLPNLRELQSLLDYGRDFPAIDPIFGVLSASYWSSTYGADNPDSAWHVQFSRGSVQTDYNYFEFHVRAVRSAP